MTIFKNIFARVWAVWGLVSFITTFLLIFIPSMCTYLMPAQYGQKTFIAIAKLWMNIWLRLVLCPVKIVGKENFKQGKTYVVTCNHNTLLDVPLSSPYIPNANKTIAKKSFAKVPLFGWFYKKGSVLVDRSNEKSRKKSFDEMKQTLATGIHMCIYPEGTRNRTTEPLKTFYDGAFKLATDTKTPIIPTLIFNTGKALPNNKFFYFLPHKLQIHFLPEVSASNITTTNLKNTVFEIMHNYYVQNK